MRNAIWNVGRKLMVGTVLAVGLLGTGAVAANAAPRDFRGPVGREYARGYERPVGRGYGYGYARPGFGVAIGAPYASAYIPPCPGDGYVWLVGAWVFRGGYRGGYGYGPVARFDHERGFGRGFDRGGYRGRR
jgi:hypothetical protein